MLPLFLLGVSSVVPSIGLSSVSSVSASVSEELPLSILSKEKKFLFTPEAKTALRDWMLGKGFHSSWLRLSEKDLVELSKKIPENYLEKYMDIVGEMEWSGKRYTKRSHYQAIIDMATADGVIL